MGKIREIIERLEACTPEERQQVFDYLRAQHLIHPLERSLNVRAETILEAINRANDLTLRGIRGIITEAVFEKEILPRFPQLTSLTLAGDHPYDFLLADAQGECRVQVKMQRKEKQRPMIRSGMYVVETQRTRSGRDRKNSKRQTRPYRFGDFDVLAVSLQPATGDWRRFLFTVALWLHPRPDDPTLIRTYQPVARAPNDDWTDDLATCIEWWRSGIKKRIRDFDS